MSETLEAVPWVAYERANRKNSVIVTVTTLVEARERGAGKLGFKDVGKVDAHIMYEGETKEDAKKRVAEAR